jgi:hypothetical protein
MKFTKREKLLVRMLSLALTVLWNKNVTAKMIFNNLRNYK